MTDNPSPEQALKILDEATGLLNLNRAQHLLVVKSINVLYGVVHGQDTDPAPTGTVGEAAGD